MGTCLMESEYVSLSMGPIKAHTISTSAVSCCVAAVSFAKGSFFTHPFVWECVREPRQGHLPFLATIVPRSTGPRGHARAS